MRIIHTSDWHLGRQFGPMSLRADQEAFADWFVTLVADQQADLVVIAGDLYDRAIPPVEAIGLFRETIRRMLDTGTVVAAITGNHDGADRVAPYSELLDLSRFYLRGAYERVGEVVTHEFADGPTDLVLLPFLDPQAAPDTFGVEPAVDDSPADGQDAESDADADLVERRQRRTHASVLQSAADLARARLRSPRSVALSHAYVTGGEASDSERQLVVGGTGEVPVSVFEGFSYTALGHLHRPQRAGSDTVRYSGTPLAYSFSEEHDKSVVVVDLAADGTTQIETVPVEVGRRVRTITGDIDHLLSAPELNSASACFVRAIVTDRETVLDARAKLTDRFPHIVEVRLLPAGVDPSAGPALPEVSELAPIDAARQFWATVEGAPPEAEVDAVLVAATAAATGRGDS